MGKSQHYRQKNQQNIKCTKFNVDVSATDMS